MGLDMYLDQSIHFADFYNKNLYDQLKQIQFPICRNHEGITSQFQVCYWRKANAIHNWFVKNVQDGKDECQQSYVLNDKLKELLNIVNDVLKNAYKDGEINKEYAIEKLPPVSGFFFGSTEIDECYFEDLERTSKILTEIVQSPHFENAEFYYRASW